ncbi:2OG-Fe(II) oxygenase [Sphingomonas sp.]|uniref:2OG-Fe(II) oxygenase n=1 Tax=Sphingomonas sp. TaxID=28214 RepID=UPI001B013450|nr:2OG-Fe(II) oxygenase [Sphingomonas sp.]MBO9712816.1 2OG-Fe(II) oxygenase [Sphingomonas sp.]
MSETGRENRGSPGFERVPPHARFRDFLDPAEHARLRDWAFGREAEFEPSVVDAGQLRPEIRHSYTLGQRKLREWHGLLSDRIMGRLGDLCAAVGVERFAVARIETQLLTYGDGAYYRQHIDSRFGKDIESLRVLSAVYYFHAEPKAYLGGELRLHALAPGIGRYIDLTPEQNMLLVFPSWAPHEVLPVQCPSGRFIDSRFAVNCWVRSAPRAAAAGPLGAPQ